MDKFKQETLTISVVRIQQLKGFLNVWRMTQAILSPALHPLEIAIAFEETASKIRSEEAQRMKSQPEEKN